MKKLIEIAIEAGASTAKLMDVNNIFIDERVRLKCYVPRCDAYGRHLMCPPHTLSVKEFKKILSQYKKALIVQIEAHQNSLDKSKTLGLEDKELFEEQMKALRPFKTKAAEVIDKVEKEAFKMGYAYAAGLGSGRCELCGAECPGIKDEICRHPFKARPAMEAMGIDVQRTAENVGLSVKLSSDIAVRFTGLILID